MRDSMHRLTLPHRRQIGGVDIPNHYMSASSNLSLFSTDLPPPVEAVLRITRFPESFVVDIYNRLRFPSRQLGDDVTRHSGDVHRRSHSHDDGATPSGSDATCTGSRDGNGATRAESDVRGRARGDDKAVAQAVSAADLLFAVDEEIAARGGGGSNELFPFSSLDIMLLDTQQNHTDTRNAQHHGHCENPNPDSTSTHHQHMSHSLPDIAAPVPLNNSETVPNPVPLQPSSLTEANLGLTALADSLTSPADYTSPPLLSLASASVTPVGSTSCSLAQVQGAQTTGASVYCSERQSTDQTEVSVNTSSSSETTEAQHYDSGEASMRPQMSLTTLTPTESDKGFSVGTGNPRFSGVPDCDSEQPSLTHADPSPSQHSDEETPPTEVETRERRRQQERLRALRAENRRLKARNLCRQCRQRPVTLTLLPCGHFCFCEQCGSAFSACPVCRKTILADVRTFVS